MTREEVRQHGQSDERISFTCLILMFSRQDEAKTWFLDQCIKLRHFHG